MRSDFDPAVLILVINAAFTSHGGWNFPLCCSFSDGAEGGGVAVLEERKLPAGQELSAQRDLIRCYQPPLFQLLMTWCQSLSLKAPAKKRKKNVVSSFLSSRPPFLPPPSFFLACFRSVEMSQSEVSEQSCNSGSTDHFWGPLCCICALPWCSWDVNEQCFTAQHTAVSLWSARTAGQRLTGNGVNQACWEHDGGPDLPAGGLA